ncbi:MAG TPA: tRNA (guanosine(46)-N7)-methyltransferase TrmB [Salinisphaeraceae bacterium]|nr:tRNA (guanosine(46)-N7)-methyltransferase TrmB [Salinisphaeraceae bacterium]
MQQHDRRIRSFVRREGRMTRGQQQRLDQLWPRYGLAVPEQPPDWDAIFGRRAPRMLEIGFGAGEVLAALAAANPQRDFIGIEVYRAGIGRLLGRLADNDADNVRIFCGDAADILPRAFAPASLAEVLLYFPDPWPKKRHHKRRIVQPQFADAIARVLAPGGVWRLASDWEDYAMHMRSVLDAHPLFANIGDQDGWVQVPPRASTRFEQRGRRKGHQVRDLAYRRTSMAAPRG